MGEMPWRDQIIVTPQGIYVPEHLAGRLPIDTRPRGLLDSTQLMLGKPVYIIPAPRKPEPKRWWVRAWRWLSQKARQR